MKSSHSREEYANCQETISSDALTCLSYNSKTHSQCNTGGSRTREFIIVSFAISSKQKI